MDVECDECAVPKNLCKWFWTIDGASYVNHRVSLQFVMCVAITLNEAYYLASCWTVPFDQLINGCMCEYLCVCVSHVKQMLQQTACRVNKTCTCILLTHRYTVIELKSEYERERERQFELAACNSLIISWWWIDKPASHECGQICNRQSLPYWNERSKNHAKLIAPNQIFIYH